MRYFVYFLLLLSPCSWAASLPSPAEIRALYANMNEADYQKKLHEPQDEFHYLRTFVPVYYLLLNRNHLPSFTDTAAWNQSGWCVGDAHPENFGVVVGDSGATTFAMNDIDDGGPCPLIADAMRFFVAVHLYDSSIDLHELFKSYAKGLKGDPLDYSNEVQAMLEKGSGQTQPEDGWLDGASALNREKVGDDLSAAEMEIVRAAVAAAYGEVEVLDAVKYTKAAGGSGGMLRYRVLLNFPQPQVVELKEIQPPGVSQLSRGPIPGDAERLAHSLELEQGAFASGLDKVAGVGGVNMYFRPRRQGNIGVTLDKLNSESEGKDKMLNVLRDEIMLLGHLHGISASDAAAYRQAFSDLNEDAWMQAVESVSQDFSQLFQSRFE
jgi:Uncharacterized protein conserved in bacteria (DUF2252)